MTQAEIHGTATFKVSESAILDWGVNYSYLQGSSHQLRGTGIGSGLELTKGIRFENRIYFVVDEMSELVENSLKIADGLNLTEQVPKYYDLQDYNYQNSLE